MMTRPPADVGASVEEIDTPALVVDLAVYERNLDRMAASLAGAPVRLRPHAKTHKCPDVAQLQIAHGAAGVCCQKVTINLSGLSSGPCPERGRRSGAGANGQPAVGSAIVTLSREMAAFLVEAQRR
jgi:hypothetical protein